MVAHRTSGGLPDRVEVRLTRILLRMGIATLFIEAALWSAIRFLTFIYVLAQEAELGPRHQTPGWVRLRVLAITVAGAVVLFKAGAAVRGGHARRWGRIAEILALLANIAVLVVAVAASTRFSGAQAEVTAIAVVILASASLAAIAIDLRSAVLDRHRETGRA